MTAGGAVHGMPGQDTVTRLLIEWKDGSRDAEAMLTPLVYQELRRLARRYLASESTAETLQPTALVHEAWLRLTGSSQPDWESRSHFYGVAARLMRQILIDHARRHLSQKRGARAHTVAIQDTICFAPQKSAEIIALGDALTQLEKVDPRKAQVIELRFFGGLSADETARALGISVATVGREQRLAEAWLHRELTAEEH
ncbi:MAG TPA: sigma-70 family RNA polymerase sigma factor [Bryobacteraceae bacterium]|nr:sigma-70 family RNA polymerase sigma factor [Bryobacteraceae bacterium]